MNYHAHNHDCRNKIKTNHPLKMVQREYLGHLSEVALLKRLGRDKAELFKQGVLDTSKYVSPQREDRYSIEELKKDDIASFDFKY